MLPSLYSSVLIPLLYGSSRIWLLGTSRHQIFPEEVLISMNFALYFLRNTIFGLLRLYYNM